MPEYRLSPAAQRDLEAIFDYTVRLWGSDQAVSYTKMLGATCSALAQEPERARECNDVRAGYRRYRSGQHTIYFRIERYGIAVIRILHQNMDALRHL